MKRFPFILLSLVAIALAVATLIEHQMGSDAASSLVYGSVWFQVLWGLVVISGLYLLYHLKLLSFKKPMVTTSSPSGEGWRGGLLLHLSFVVILLGALVTHYTSKSGFMHLHRKEAANTFWVKRSDGLFEGKELPFLVCLKDFRIEYDKGTDNPKDYVSEVLLVTHDTKEETTINMNHIARIKGYRIYQTSYDDDLSGSIFTINYDPWGTALTYLGYALLALGMGLIAFKEKPRHRSIETSRHRDIEASIPKSIAAPMRRGIAFWLSAAVGILLASYMVIALFFRPLVPVLRSPLLVIHVGVIMISYVLLVVSIVRRSVLRTAVFMLTAGIFLGAIWANISWGTYWSWDPKESWALITLIVYSIPLHQASLPWFRSDRHYRLYSIFCLLCLLMTYFGVNYLLTGMHSYV